jgi:hypothetical protein
MINQGMSSNPAFAQFMAQKGLKVYVKNLKVTNSDELIEMADEYMQDMQKQQQMQQQMAQQGQMNNPMMIKAQNEQADIQREAKKDQTQAQLQAVELKLKQQQLELQKVELAIKAKDSGNNMAIQLDKHNAEKTRAIADLAMQAQDMHHKHIMEENKHVLASHGHNHNVAKTVLEHAKHEASETSQEESEENE